MLIREGTNEDYELGTAIRRGDAERPLMAKADVGVQMPKRLDRGRRRR